MWNIDIHDLEWNDVGNIDNNHGERNVIGNIDNDYCEWDELENINHDDCEGEELSNDVGTVNNNYCEGGELGNINNDGCERDELSYNGEEEDESDEAGHGIESAPFSAPSDSDDVESVHLLIEVKKEEVGDSERSHSWASENSVPSCDTEVRQVQANLHGAGRNPHVCVSNQRWDEWCNGFIQVVEAHTHICNENGHCDRCAKGQLPN